MLRLIDAVGNGNGTALEVYAALWTAYKRGMESIAAIFYYLDVHWVKKNRKKSLDVAEPSNHPCHHLLHAQEDGRCVEVQS